MAKTDTYIGFAVKSGQMIFGQESVKRSYEVMCVIVSNTASEKTRKEMAYYAKTNGISLIEYDGSLNFTKSGDCKVAGITSPELAKAAIANLSDGYIEIVAGGDRDGTN